jgi:hypothetical protein
MGDLAEKIDSFLFNVDIYQFSPEKSELLKILGKLSVEDITLLIKVIDKFGDNRYESGREDGMRYNESFHDD